MNNSDRVRWESRIKDLKAELKTIEKSMEELESLNRIYPGRYDQRLSAEYSRYKSYNDKLDDLLRRMIE